MFPPSSRRLRAALILAALAAFAFTVPVSAAPADGNENKFVEVVEETGIPIDCGEETIWLDIGGWLQGREFGGTSNRNVALTVFHFVLSFSNDDGETFTYLGVGPDHVYFDTNGDLSVAIVGRPGNAGGMGFALSGRMVINLETGEATWNGKESPFAEDQACAALAG